MNQNEFDPMNPQEPQEQPTGLPVSEEPAQTAPILPEEPLAQPTETITEWYQPAPSEPAEQPPSVEEQPLPHDPGEESQSAPQPEPPTAQSAPQWWNTAPGGVTPQPIQPQHQEQQSYYYPVAPVPTEKKSKKGLRIFAFILAGVITVIFSVSAGYLVGLRSDNDGGRDDNLLPWSDYVEEEPATDSENTGDTSSFDIATGSATGEGYSYTQIVEKVSKSIVNITVYSADGQSGSYASGIIMDAKQGYVLTNDHIYSAIPNAKFLITLNNGSEFKADFVSGDSRSDIAILKIENPENLTAAEFNTDKLTVGESVLAIGQSYGYADTVSNGIVSAVDRRVSMSGGSYSEKYIQTTAAINPGNSGGALVNMHGQVVGVVSAKIASEEVEGLGFAIPADRALSIVKNLQQNGRVVGRAKLGITYTEMGTVAAEVNGTPNGLYIQEIAEDSDLYGKGFSTGDIITKVNGKEITISAIMLDVIEEATAGDSITLEIYKAQAGQSQTITVKLAEAESTHSYVTQSQQQAESMPDSESEGNDLPENPFEYYFDQDNW